MLRKNKITNIAVLSICSTVVIAVILYLFPQIYIPYVFAAKYLTITKKQKILVVWRNGLGEREVGARIIKTLPKLGVNAKFVTARNDRNRTIYDRYILEQPELAARIMQPDIVLIIDRAIKPISNFTNYIFLDQSVDTYIEYNNEHHAFKDPIYNRFKALLPTFKEIDLLREAYEQTGAKYLGFRWYPTVYTTYYKVQTPKRLFFPAGALSDPTRSSEKYIEVFKMLDRTGYFEVYGWQKSLWFLQQSYRGFIPNDGETLLKTNNQAGMSLILHSQEHLQSATPTARIFEAIAANTIIISDKHEFVIDNFGDNILYIDVDVSAQEMFDQIERHVQWIKTNPDKAREMAQRCHDIFLEKFTMEELLQKLIALQ